MQFVLQICHLGHRPHSRQVTGARCNGGRGSPVMSWILLNARPTTHSRRQGWAIKDFSVLSEMCSICEQPLYGIMLKEKETQYSFAGLLNIYISGIWLWYMQDLFINWVKQNRCLKSENPQPMVVTILPPCSGKQMWMWCSVISSLLDGS